MKKVIFFWLLALGIVLESADSGNVPFFVSPAGIAGEVVKDNAKKSAQQAVDVVSKVTVPQGATTDAVAKTAYGVFGRAFNGIFAKGAKKVAEDTAKMMNKIEAVDKAVQAKYGSTAKVLGIAAGTLAVAYVGHKLYKNSSGIVRSAKGAVAAPFTMFSTFNPSYDYARSRALINYCWNQKIISSQSDEALIFNKPHVVSALIRLYDGLQNSAQLLTRMRTAISFTKDSLDAYQKVEGWNVSFDFELNNWLNELAVGISSNNSAYPNMKTNLRDKIDEYIRKLDVIRRSIT